jgi:hypothetical protein
LDSGVGTAHSYRAPIFSGVHVARSLFFMCSAL